MKLTLDRLDLLPEHETMNCSRTKFEHFNDKSKRAIAAAGRATFREFNHSNYNAIYPPEKEMRCCLGDSQTLQRLDK